MSTLRVKILSEIAGKTLVFTPLFVEDFALTKEFSSYLIVYDHLSLQIMPFLKLIGKLRGLLARKGRKNTIEESNSNGYIF